MAGFALTPTRTPPLEDVLVANQVEQVLAAD